MQREVAKISNGLNVLLVLWRRRRREGTTDHTCVVLAEGRSRNITLPKRRRGVGLASGYQFSSLLFSDLSANLIALFSPQLFQSGILGKYTIIFHALAHCLKKLDNTKKMELGTYQFVLLCRRVGKRFREMQT